VFPGYALVAVGTITNNVQLPCDSDAAMRREPLLVRLRCRGYAPHVNAMANAFIKFWLEWNRLENFVRGTVNLRSFLLQLLKRQAFRVVCCIRQIRSCEMWAFRPRVARFWNVSFWATLMRKTEPALSTVAPPQALLPANAPALRTMSALAVQALHPP